MNMDSILSDDLIFLDKIFSSATDVIQFVGEQFEKKGYCTQNYTAAMLESFNAFPGLIVIDDGVAIPHARPETGALNDGLILIKLKDRVDFHNDDFDKVDTVIGLCSTGSDKHIQLIQLVGKLIENRIQDKVFIDKNEVSIFINNVNISMEIN